VRFDQVKILARDLQALADFYVEALDCETVVPGLVTDSAVSRAFGIANATVTLTVLRLPGRGEHGPVLELYSVGEGEVPESWDYRPGQGQMAFAVDDLEAAIDKVVSAGGSDLGEVVEWRGPSGNLARFVLLQDPEGNVIDLYQRVG
jgi:catechol 2,3-dioxygenase-like lactoylglutathione lyase family enzyme